MIYYHVFYFVLWIYSDDIVAIKVIDMNGFDNAISKEMLEC